ncbi:hypothetical protein N7516_010012 [Penicillium verrucosum]|uniref:uncharacterized protein n=1 Tax=Penicillium verrucosum TaxID=60171 RepID=UPI002545BC27|nr:uncharacterized protein N7516_010012 [Penicillium verrucosum]KAJ5922309.1 hypothetical protein N7516_010012 [Penicillium verrucosum]
MATNPTAAEIEGGPIFKESAFSSFLSYPDFSEPRIDIRLTIKRNEDGVPSAECPANATFRIFNNQIQWYWPVQSDSHIRQSNPQSAGYS